MANHFDRHYCGNHKLFFFDSPLHCFYTKGSPEREPLRIFYESLSKQIPSSEMAEIWMMEHGLLSAERAKKAYERKQRKQQQARTGTPIKSPPKQERPESSKKQQAVKNGDVKAKKRVNYSDDDDDFIIQKKKLKG